MRGLIFILLMLILASATYAVNLDIKVFTKDGDVKNFGTIRTGIDEEVTIFMVFENENINEDIDNLDITVTVEAFNGSEYEIEFDEFDLRPGKDKQLQFTIYVPAEVSERDYDIEILYEGDEKDKEFSETEDFFIKVDKNSHDVRFTSLALSNENVECKESSLISISLQNYGTNDENVNIIISNDELKFRWSRVVLLEQFPGNDKYSNDVAIISNTAGIFPFDIEINYGGIIERDSLTLNVVCGGDGLETNENLQEITEIKSAQPETDETSTRKVIQEDETFSLVTLLILIIIAVLIIIGIKVRKK